MGFFDKMKAAFNNAMADFTGENEEAYETLEEMLILSDAGMDTTEDIMEKLRRPRPRRGLPRRGAAPQNARVHSDRYDGRWG